MILLAEGGTVQLSLQSSLMMMQFADLGKRLIVTASPAMGESVHYANRMLEAIGMFMVDRDIDSGPLAPEGGIPMIEWG